MATNLVDNLIALGLKEYLKQVPTGTYLFRQGQMGRTMIIILKGCVELLGEKDGEEHIANLLGPGQFLGEKAMLKDAPYSRVFGARARTSTVYLELGLTDINKIQMLAPEAMIDILKRAFQIAVERLERANYLGRILRSSDNDERFVELLLYLSRSTGTLVNGQREFFLSIESIYYYLDMDIHKVETYLEKLISGEILQEAGNGLFTIPNEQLLYDFLASLKKKKWEKAA